MTRRLSPRLRVQKTSLEPLIGLFYPRNCRVCMAEQAGAEEGFICFFCRNRPGAIQHVVPPYCEHCGLPHEGEIGSVYRCANCADIRLHFDWARASVVATPFILDLIHRYKYQGQTWFEPFFIRLFLDGVSRFVNPSEWDAVVPTPLHPIRLRERGFNQAFNLARAASALTGLGLWKGCVKRVAPTQTQTTLSRKKRMQNVDRAFECHEPERVRGLRLLLVDDILTTGATTGSCARVLKRAGATMVGVITLARGR